MKAYDIAFGACEVIAIAFIIAAVEQIIALWKQRKTLKKLNLLTS